jgi:hypothetical protein
MKGGQEHSVPLSSAALWALELMQAKRTGDAVFPGRGGAPLADTSFATAPKKAGLDAGAPHSWRSIFRDWPATSTTRRANSPKRRSRTRSAPSRAPIAGEPQSRSAAR